MAYPCPQGHLPCLVLSGLVSKAAAVLGRAWLGCLRREVSDGDSDQMKEAQDC